MAARLLFEHPGSSSLNKSFDLVDGDVFTVTTKEGAKVFKLVVKTRDEEGNSVNRVELEEVATEVVSANVLEPQGEEALGVVEPSSEETLELTKPKRTRVKS